MTPESFNIVAMVMGALQFLLLIIIALIAFIFKFSLSKTNESILGLKDHFTTLLTGVTKSIDEIKEDRKEDRKDRKAGNDLIHTQLRELREKKADKEDLDKLEARFNEMNK